MRHLLSLLLLITVTAQAAGPGKSAVASAHPLATQAGLNILEQGGNAFDAAVAVAATLAVVEPYSAGMGGGGFWLLHREQDGLQTFVDARETAPDAATAAMYQNKEGKVMRDWAVNGPSAAGIPGQAAAFVHLADNYGKLPLTSTLAPAIALAEHGFHVEEHYRKLAGYRKDVLNRFPEAAAIFLHNGKVPPNNHLIKQADLARVLRALAEKGNAGFYQGEVAKQLVDGVQQAGGIWTLDDLANYKVVERTPTVSQFRGGRVISAPPPSSGGIVMGEALNILSQLNDGNTAEITPHLAIEAMRRAYQDRARYLGDPDFVDIPVDKLLSIGYAKQRASSITLDKATASSSLGEPVGVEEGFHTTHFSVLDKDGNRVAATLSINLPFGSGFVAPGTGVLLNNEMDDFSAKPGSPNAYGLVGSQANAIAPGKRPLSSMTPTFVEFDDRIAILGTPGGSRIISMVMLAVLEASNNKPVEDWVNAVRYHHQYLPDEVQAEPAFIDSQAAKDLVRRGHKVVSTGRNYGNMQAILWRQDSGEVTAASDPRGIGSAEIRAPHSSKEQSTE
ncbi:MAG: gamma-glutamyltransferase [Alcanivorax borkumensis]|jgi:gamma-glutamyltranspeptidase/glutathione hydrolase|uniref:Glutathione hydrolase proenzyme n=1 Tax=Alcanivorax borkumensis (strain ATCC 700651 / DSM 11573 / NCIMB 13689 / SK2) TaxID=393595 RepID=Q0VKT3_ALCBS|nr:gamma-glutamyltransferase [Alcanivorax borkumensis]OJH08849.1 MAG: gamma-glutamyltransferase [Alcanivorax borkumensis]CAL15528.1 gamma-glutamyltransferase precursor [Alcanivorax borkumensis SK2]